MIKRYQWKGHLFPLPRQGSGSAASSPAALPPCCPPGSPAHFEPLLPAPIFQPLGAHGLGLLGGEVTATCCTRSSSIP